MVCFPGSCFIPFSILYDKETTKVDFRTLVGFSHPTATARKFTLKTMNSFSS